LLCAVAAIRAFERERKDAAPIAAGLAITWIALGAAAIVFVRRIDWLASNPDAISNGAPQSAYAIPILLLAAGVAIGVAALLRSSRWTIALCVLCVLISVETANLMILPRVEERFSARPFAQLIQNDPHADRVFVYELPRAWTYGLLFYLGRQIPEWSPSDPNPALVLTTPKALQEIRGMGRSSGSLGETRGRQQPVIYVPVNAAAHR
jgi:hypothetical protein